jgi:hypothetical protein
MSNLDVLKARVEAAEGHAVSTLVVGTVEMREMLDELARLEAGRYEVWKWGHEAGYNDAMLSTQSNRAKPTPNPFPEVPDEA